LEKNVWFKEIARKEASDIHVNGWKTQPFPFSSFPKYVVHLSFRASLLKNNELFLHLLEQNQKIDPSFFTNIMPVPAGNSLPQNEHFLGLGISDLSRQSRC
jgi:hypothetical protein